MIRTLITLCTCALLISGCASSKRPSGGAYYKDDGPDSSVPANIQAIPDAVPRIEAHAPANRRPYVVLGKRYVPLTDEKTFKQKGMASWYGRKFHGNKTANGEVYDMYAMTAAHPTLPLPSYARVTHAHSGNSVIVRINDRGPFHRGRIIDLSYAAAAKLNLIKPGQGPVIVEAITHADIRNNAYKRSDQPTPQAMPIPAAAPSAQPLLTASATPPASGLEAQTQHSGTSAPLLPPEHPDVRPDALVALSMASQSPEPTALSAETPPKAQTSIPGLQATHADPASSPQPDNRTNPGNEAEQDTAVVFLQYGAFSAQENAHKLATHLNHEIAHIEPRRAEIASSANVHRVHIGPYRSRTQAVNAALRIQSATGREATYATQDSNNTTGTRNTALSL